MSNKKIMGVSYELIPAALAVIVAIIAELILLWQGFYDNMTFGFSADYNVYAVIAIAVVIGLLVSRTRFGKETLKSNLTAILLLSSIGTIAMTLQAWFYANSANVELPGVAYVGIIAAVISLPLLYIAKKST